MAQPKRKHSKARTRKRQGANRFELPVLARDPEDNSICLRHRVNPNNGMYRGRKVLSSKHEATQ